MLPSSGGNHMVLKVKCSCPGMTNMMDSSEHQAMIEILNNTYLLERTNCLFFPASFLCTCYLLSSTTQAKVSRKETNRTAADTVKVFC